MRKARGNTIRRCINPHDIPNAFAASISIIALDELLRWSKVAAETSKQPFTFYLAAAAIYLFLTILSDLVRNYFEAKANRGIAPHA